MVFECSGLKNASDRFEKMKSILANSYNCEWSDEVHESFKKFIAELEEYSSYLKSSSNNIDSVCQEVNSLHIEQEKNTAEKLNRSARELCQKARSLL